MNGFSKGSMRVIGITGTLGAGKGTIVDYLVHAKGFAHFSVRAFLTEEIRQRGLPVNRDSMVVVANDLRARHNPAFIVEQLYEQALQTGHDCIIESIRTPGEVAMLRSKPNFRLIAVDAAPEVRYQRIVERASETDHISFETFLQNEQREMDTTDPNAQNLRKCIEQADFNLTNNSTVENLHKKILEVLNNF